MDIFVDISPQFTVSIVIVYSDRKYDSTFEVDQQNFSERLYWSIHLFQCITGV